MKKNLTHGGIDYFHPAFRDENGKTRILYLWNQNIEGELAGGREPSGYGYGAQYDSSDINDALDTGNRRFAEMIVPASDGLKGHGTAVASIAAGSLPEGQRASVRGIAYESGLIVVALKRSSAGSGEYTRTIDIMEGIDYTLRKAIELKMPVVINLSFGTNEGAHDGNTLFENYITDINGIWKNIVVVAAGNEGDSRHHVRTQVSEDSERTEFAIGENERNIRVFIWKYFQDEFQTFLNTPSGKRINITDSVTVSSSRENIDSVMVMPTPYNAKQLMEVQIRPNVGADHIVSGIWSIEFLITGNIKCGVVDMWLPTLEAVGLSTGFLRPSPDTTVTIPATARKVLSVGAFNEISGSMAAFSGRGYTADGRLVPLITAYGVNIDAAGYGGGYVRKTGTSFAAPKVSGYAARIMEWGIVRGNDENMYGEKLIAYMTKYAAGIEGEQMPGIRQGWGLI